MDFKLKTFILLLIVGTTLAQFEEYGGYEGYQHKAPVQLHEHQSVEEHHSGGGEEYDLDYFAHPKYSFDYSVKDPHTGDHKEHWETRDGDKVKGSYTLLETDGTKRVVEYEADDKNGFNAVVHRIGTPQHVEHESTPVHEPAHYQQHQSTPVHEPAHYQLHDSTPVHEPAHYQQDYVHFDQGFAQVAEGYEH